jgi:hypothetical protein
MAREGPFDGLLGFSQGAGLSAVLAGLQEQVTVACHGLDGCYTAATSHSALRFPAGAGPHWGCSGEVRDSYGGGQDQGAGGGREGV